MRILLMFSLCLLPLAPHFGVTSHELQSYFLLRSKHRSTKLKPVSPTIAPSGVPAIWTMAPWAPVSSPAYPPLFFGPSASTPHYRMPHVISPTSYAPPKENCEQISCSDPLTRTPIGSPCGCVYPIKVIIDLGVAPILLFPQIAELEVEVASGTFLKQSQVRIMGADASVHSQDKTTVTIYLVPLGERFDKMTALLIYDRFWQKKVQISTSIFGDYDVISVFYPGLPSSLPPMIWGPSDISPSGSQQYPFTANVPVRKRRARTKTNFYNCLFLYFTYFGLRWDVSNDSQIEET
ncbi:hypothetical protein HPP92_008830 [Vanilla planifolia]|uniref:Receptor-like PK ALE2 N-terminal domain-containing protein n=1 Tax=Vanilla planifolia TaxID=51239 RepID=A0A835RER2_VANPL|nr:hypothetical protein HPP92_009062 [Vanilla planifolia]KAG0486735.1 hypothetical protein HPP92_008830 [Vanilla planifolia]